MGKRVETKQGKPVETEKRRCPVCSHNQVVRKGAVNPECERCGTQVGSGVA